MTGKDWIACPNGARAQRLRRLWNWLADCTRTCLAHYDAAASYQELSRLSDAELRRRGLDRSTLARELFERRTSRS